MYLIFNHSVEQIISREAKTLNKTSDKSLFCLFLS